MKKLLLILIPVLLFGGDLYYYNNGKKVELFEESNPTLKRSADTSYYKNSYNMELGVNQYALVKLKPGILIVDIENEYGVTFVSKVTETIYKFKTASPLKTIEFSQRVVEDSKAKFAHPDFIRKIKRR